MSDEFDALAYATGGYALALLGCRGRINPYANIERDASFWKQRPAAIELRRNRDGVWTASEPYGPRAVGCTIRFDEAQWCDPDQPTAPMEPITRRLLP